jgi:FAD/FMN-containing dehydrogenase
MVDKLISSLRDVLGPEGVLTGADVTRRRAGIWSEEPVRARAILRPCTTPEVMAVLSACSRVGQSVVTHGGLTGLVEASLAVPKDVVLSLERMNRVEAIDRVGRTMTAQAGATLQHVQEQAEATGLMLPLDLGARGSCTLGGNAATNAGGNRVIRYGMMRDMVLGLEAVLADGTLISSMNTMLKNNAGYDLKHLFIGTEGTLGVITRLVMRLRPMWRSQETALIACNDFASVTGLLNRMDSLLGGTMSAFEVMWQDYYQLVTSSAPKSEPPLAADYPYYVLIEALGGDPTQDADRFIDSIAAAEVDGLVVEAALAKSRSERDGMWAIRDDVEKCLQFEPCFVFDVSLGLKHMEAYVNEVTASLSSRWKDSHVFVFGHLGDGNIHFVIAAGDGSGTTRQGVEESVYEPLRRIGGSVSAEHGIGLEKKPYLSWCRSANEISLMRTLKQTMDPVGILNPGKVFDLAATE